MSGAWALGAGGGIRTASAPIPKNDPYYKAKNAISGGSIQVLHKK